MSHHLWDGHKLEPARLQLFDDNGERLKRLLPTAAAIVQQDDGAVVGVAEYIRNDGLAAGAQPIDRVHIPENSGEPERVSNIQRPAVIVSIGRPEEGGANRRDLLNHIERAGELLENPISVQFGEIGMIPGMVAYGMPICDYGPGEVRIALHPGAKHKEGGLDVVAPQEAEYSQRITGRWAVVKGQRNFRELGIAMSQKSWLEE